ncbi:hypothetical protein [Pseudomonas nicosulfuronedens]|jgi:hypothetical protein
MSMENYTREVEKLHKELQGIADSEAELAAKGKAVSGNKKFDEGQARRDQILRELEDLQRSVQRP